MYWISQIIGSFLLSFFSGYIYRSYKLKRQLVNKKDWEEMLSSHCLSNKQFSIHYVAEIVIKMTIIFLIAIVIYLSTFESVSKTSLFFSIKVVQIIVLVLSGFVAGYTYRSYKLGFQLIDKKQFKNMLEGYGLIDKPEKYHYLIDTTVKFILIALIAVMIYFSVYTV